MSELMIVLGDGATNGGVGDDDKTASASRAADIKRSSLAR